MQISSSTIVLIGLFLVLLLIALICSSVALAKSVRSDEMTQSFPLLYPQFTSQQPKTTFGSFSFIYSPSPSLPQRTRNSVDALQELIQNGNFNLPPIEKSDQSIVATQQFWTTNDPTTLLFGSTSDQTDFGDMGATYVVLKQSQKIMQNVTIEHSCGYTFRAQIHAKNSSGGSCLVTLYDALKKKRAQYSYSPTTIVPSQLKFEKSEITFDVFLNPGLYTLEISGQTQTTIQQSIAVTQISFSQSFVGSPIVIDLPYIYQNIPTIYCSLATTTLPVNDYLKNGFLLTQASTDPSQLVNGYSELFQVSAHYNTNSFFTASVYGPFNKDLFPSTAKGIVLTLNWMAIGI